MTVNLRDEAARHDELLKRRLDDIVPALMRRQEIDCWIVAGREYAEDPVLSTMLPFTWLSARRRTVLIWFDDGSRHERFAVSRYPVADLFATLVPAGTEPGQWSAVAGAIAARDPKKIAVGLSPTFPLADGLTASEYRGLIEVLGPRADRVVSAEALAIGWLETRLPEERATYSEACTVAHEILRRGLSSEAITPGTTSTVDLEWWYRQAVHDAGLQSWFHPTVSIQRRSGAAPQDFATRPTAEFIASGDLVHVDFGIVWKGLCTDQQEHLYIPAPGETGPLPGLTAGMAAGNRMQDLLMAEFVSGRTGNEILAASLAAAEAESIDALVYSHPIGFHGHAAGPTIGLWDRQDGVAGAGDYPLFPNTAYSIELSVEVAVPEWNDQRVRIMLEQDAWFDGGNCTFLDGRQETLWTM